MDRINFSASLLPLLFRTVDVSSELARLWKCCESVFLPICDWNLYEIIILEVVNGSEVFVIVFKWTILY